MATKTRKVTPRMVEANRKNAKKSTGPRTPQGKQNVAYNALQHGFYAKPSLKFMLAEHLAMLHWQKRRNQRAQAGAISDELETLDINSEEQCRERDREQSGMS